MPNSISKCISTLLLAASALTLPARADKGLLDPGRFAVGLNYTGITYHPDGGENEEPYKRALDDGDFWVLLVGFQANADYKLHRFVYLRTATSFYKDCSDLWAGFYHFGFRANWDVTERLSLRIGVGPTLLWRENWYGKVKGYTKDSFFGAPTGGKYQSAFIWHGGDAEAEWKASDRLSLVYAMIPGYPEVIQNSLGLRMNF